MKRLSIWALLATAIVSWCSTAIARPLPSIAHRGPVQSAWRPLFDKLQTDFSGGRIGPYTVAGSDISSRTLVIKRNDIDLEHWSRWAYCRVAPLAMFDSLRDGMVTLTIKLEPTTRTITYAVVTADFTGVYGLGSSTNTVRCTSTGVLEESILHSIGVTTP